MDKKAIEKELADCERAFWQAMKDENLDMALELTDENCIVAGPQGYDSISRQQFSEMMRNNPYKLESYKFLGPLTVHILTPEVGVVAYKVEAQMIVEGKKILLEAADTSTWVKREGNWVCAMHAEALIGDPFGRDLKRAA